MKLDPSVASKTAGAGRSGSHNPTQDNKAVKEASTAQRPTRCESSSRSGNPTQAAESRTLNDGEIDTRTPA